MRLDTNSCKATGTGLVNATNQFKIAQTPQMMELLSTKLYTRPVEAVIRELTCNAIDAHKEAGVTTKVKVTMPTTLEPTFIVKDFGKGLSEEDVMELYTTYGYSSKRDSNDLIGGFGVGSKSPFAITTEFTVVSRYEHKATTYLCYISEGIPNITKVSQINCDDTGLTVQVPVKSISDFERNRSIFKGFSKELVDVCNMEVVLFEDAYTQYYKNLYKGGDSWSGLSIKMGSVIYRTSINRLNGFVIEVPIGTYKITASRESLELNNDIEKELEEYVKTLCKEAVKVKFPNGIKTRTSFEAANNMLQYVERTDVVDARLLEGRKMFFFKFSTNKQDYSTHYKYRDWRDTSYFIKVPEITKEVRANIKRYFRRRINTRPRYINLVPYKQALKSATKMLDYQDILRTLSTFQKIHRKKESVTAAVRTDLLEYLDIDASYTGEVVYTETYKHGDLFIDSTDIYRRFRRVYEIPKTRLSKKLPSNFIRVDEALKRDYKKLMLQEFKDIRSRVLHKLHQEPFTKETYINGGCVFKEVRAIVELAQEASDITEQARDIRRRLGYAVDENYKNFKAYRDFEDNLEKVFTALEEETTQKLSTIKEEQIKCMHILKQAVR